VLDEADGTELERPVVRTDTTLDSEGDAERVSRAVERALGEVGE
jgi:LPPG:FO 2-phospho-L-lactate transferase